MNPRRQRDLGEQAAIEWLWSRGAVVFFPLGHSPDFDLIADLEGRLVRVQVKTTSYVTRTGNFQAMLCTRGGNRSWGGTTKLFSPSRCDFLFVLAADGRQWFIPSDQVRGGMAITLGGLKYAEFEVERGRALAGFARA